jgi:CheY-like chemotaxis protein
MSPNKHLILYAEDDLDDYLMVREAFEIHDHIEVLHVVNGHQAIVELNELCSSGTKPCLIILDINMPIMNGRDALQKIKSHPEHLDIPVVLFSTSSNPLDKIYAENWGAELISKPIQYRDLDYLAKLFVDKCNFELNRLKQKQ